MRNFSTTSSFSAVNHHLLYSQRVEANEAGSDSCSPAVFSHQPQESPQLPWLQPLQTSQQIKSKKYQLLLTMAQNTQEAAKVPLVHHANTLFQLFHPLGVRKKTLQLQLCTHSG